MSPWVLSYGVSWAADLSARFEQVVVLLVRRLWCDFALSDCTDLLRFKYSQTGMLASRLGFHPRVVLRRTPAVSPVAMAATNTTVKKMKVVDITPESFRPFGQLITPTVDGKMYDAEDAQLCLDHGTPRFYIMRLPKRSLRFHRITFHAEVTQCLGGLGSAFWYMAVARPSGSVENYPREEDLAAFKIPPGVFVKLERGTWHAGPLFVEPEHIDFYNLELSDTNTVDHNTHDYHKHDGFEFELETE